MPDDEALDLEMGDDDAGEDTERMNVVDLKERSMPDLLAMAESLHVENAAGLRSRI